MSPLYEIPWMCAAALSNPKESAEVLERRMTRLSASRASWKWDFHFSQVWSSRGNPLDLDRSSGKLFSVRRERNVTATIQASDIARPACLDFCCASLQRVMNYGTLWSSTHQDNIPCWVLMTSIASPPVLVAPSWLRISRRVTFLKRVVSF